MQNFEMRRYLAGLIYLGELKLQVGCVKRLALAGHGFA